MDDARRGAVKHRRPTFGALGLAAVLTVGSRAGGCSVRGMLRKLTPPAADSTARAALALASGGRARDIEPMLDPRARTPEFTRALDQIQAGFRPFTVGTAELVNARWARERGEVYWTLTYESRLHPSVAAAVADQGALDYWAATEIVLSRDRGRYRILGFHVNASDRSLAQANGFFENLGVPQALWLLLCGAALGGMVLAIAQVVRAPIRRKWLWVAVSLVGVARGWMSWNTGALGMQTISFQLFVIGWYRPGLYGPWLVYCSFPVGALWALEVVRRSRRVQEVAVDSAPGSAGTDQAPPVVDAAAAAVNRATH